MGDYEDRDGAQIHRLANIVGDVKVGKGSRIDAFVTITGTVSIGRNVHISTGACLFGGEGIWIGDYAAVSAGVKVFTATEDLSGEMLTNPTVPAYLRRTISHPVSIGRHCVIGANSVLLPGAQIGEGACTGALSLVKSELDPWGIYAGIPAKFKRLRSRQLLNLQRQYEES